jgi:hypothetical protein
VGLLTVHFVNELVFELKVVGIICVTDSCDGEEDLKAKVSALAKDFVHFGGTSGFVVQFSFKLVGIRLIGRIIRSYTLIFKDKVPAI